jgi:hypothetical protein
MGKIPKTNEATSPRPLPVRLTKKENCLLVMSPPDCGFTSQPQLISEKGAPIKKWENLSWLKILNKSQRVTGRQRMPKDYN